MATNILTEAEFSKHVGTQFHATFEDREISLTLIEVKPYMVDESRERNMERFSLFFDGPPDVLLPQQNFQMRHESMGEFDLFLVPISGDQKGFRYEAVFNYFK
jgi:hypothetical protein